MMSCQLALTDSSAEKKGDRCGWLKALQISCAKVQAGPFPSGTKHLFAIARSLISFFQGKLDSR